MPYELYSVTSSVAIDWYNGVYASASQFDVYNINALSKTIPEFILDDGKYGWYYRKFINMVGHQFDNTYLYATHLSDIYNRDNSLYEGLAKDLVYNVLTSYGIDILDNYQFDDVWKYALGTNVDGAYHATSSLLETASFVISESVPLGDIYREYGKRILNNLPYILKTMFRVKCFRK